MKKVILNKYTKYIGVRLPEEVYNKLIEISDFRGEDVSDFVRRAILKELASLSFLNNTQKKASGMTNMRDEERQQRRENKTIPHELM
jgi:metal-responsive CopG/Arc/MetJ family transcriptional regulator